MLIQIDSPKVMEDLLNARNGWDEDFEVLDADGSPWVVMHDEYEDLVVQELGGGWTERVRDTDTIYGPAINGAWDLYGPFYVEA